MPNLQFLFIICVIFCLKQTVKTERNLQFDLTVKLCSENENGTVCSSGTVAMLRNVDVTSCETACKVRKICQYINYNFRMNICLLIRKQNLNETVTMVTTSGFAFGDKSDWDMTPYENCNTCSDAEVCIPDTGLCTIQECHSIYGQEQPYSYAVGNEFGIGKKIVYKCEDSHVIEGEDSATAECLPDGTWTQPSYVCIDKDECLSDPCLNGGQCNNLIGQYSCTCAGGWTGVNCETDIDECAITPCKNDGQCFDAVNAFTCACTAGWTGTVCERDIDECASNPCNNEGTCIDMVNMYTCTCAGGWTGTHCDTDVNECASVPCENGGTCNDLVNGYSCTCAGGWTGSMCQTDVNECASVPCENGGTCNDLVNGYSCTCAGGWTGSLCQTDVNECASAPCENGGTCNDLVNGYSCMCASGWTGSMCQTDVNECASAPCENGGTCNDLVNGYSCTCAGGWTGSLCQNEVNECASAPCENGGTCNDLVNGYSCMCASGWTGSMCQTDVNECASAPCENGGTCNDLVNGYSCTCAGGWTGSMCQTANVQCSAGWSNFSTSCYRLEANRLTSIGAQNECERLGGHLADVTSQAEMDFLQSLYLESHLVEAVDGVWIAGNDSTIEGQWKLSGGSSMSYFNWHIGQPDEQLPEDDCIQVWPNNDFKWNDVLCTFTFWFYCEKLP